MGGFRGIGDTATDVKMKQDQMALQASEGAANRSASASMANASRAESARQANMSMTAQQQRMAEDARRFDAGLAVQQENTEYQRGQTEQANAENQRRFELGEQRAGRMESRQLTTDEFRQKLDQRRFDMDSRLNDVQYKTAGLQLQQYVAAADEEKKMRAGRERMAMAGFGGLLIAGELNGGTIPVKALEVFNQQNGDKENQAVGGFKDPETGIWTFNIKNETTKQIIQKRMTPDNQYKTIHGGFGKQDADLFMDLYKSGSSQRLGMERTAFELAQRAAYEEARITAREEAKAKDPFKMAGSLQKQADVFMKMTDVTNTSISDDQKKDYAKKASDLLAKADRLLLGEQAPAEQKQFLTLTPEQQSQYGIKPGAKMDPRPDGGVTYYWYNGDKTLAVDIGPDGKPIESAQPVKQATPAAPVPAKTSVPAPKPQTGPNPPSDKEFNRYGIQVERDAKGNPISATIGTSITGFRDASVKEAMELYEKKRLAKEQADAKKQEEDRKKEEESKALDARADAAYKANRAAWKL